MFTPGMFMGLLFLAILIIGLAFWLAWWMSIKYLQSLYRWNGYIQLLLGNGERNVWSDMYSMGHNRTTQNLLVPAGKRLLGIRFCNAGEGYFPFVTINARRGEKEAFVMDTHSTELGVILLLHTPIEPTASHVSITIQNQPERMHAPHTDPVTFLLHWKLMPTDQGPPVGKPVETLVALEQ